MATIQDALGAYQFVTVDTNGVIEAIYFNDGVIRMVDKHGPKILISKGIQRYLLPKDRSKKEGGFKLDFVAETSIEEAAKKAKEHVLYEELGSEVHKAEGYPCALEPSETLKNIFNKNIEDFTNKLGLKNIKNQNIQWKVKLEDKKNPTPVEKTKLRDSNKACIDLFDADDFPVLKTV